MPRDADHWEVELVTLLVKEALHATTNEEHTALLNTVLRVFSDLHRLRKQQLEDDGILLGLPDIDVVSAAGEDVLLQAAIFVRALLGFDEKTPASRLANAAASFNWDEFVQDRNTYPMVAYVVALVQNMTLSVLVVLTSRTRTFSTPSDN